MKHYTPGPWTWVSQHEAEKAHAFEIAQVNHWRIVPDREHTSIDQEGDDISDARLIAAVPELLALLQEAVKNDLLSGALNAQARALIIKATGRLP